jgi:Zn-dependent protease with chaperone function
MARAATMDFFARQDDARRRTGLLVFFYGCAVAMIIATVYFAIHWAVRTFLAQPDAPPAPLWDPTLLLWVGGSTLAIVGIGSAVKIAQLAQGGSAVAEMLGGRPIAPDTTDPAERRLLNVVEEMAIASGTSVPAVYVLDEERGINAFAAGFTLNDAVVAVTRGTLERLTRDELQGVVAHEFSHILNGDMRLNIKLTGVLHGILAIALVGYALIRSVRFSGSSRRNSKGGGGGLVLALLAAGVTLWVIGYIGVFFANLIKSAVSRQREFLADASAVQYTRNPEGIGGALKKIAGLSAGSRIQNNHASEAGHFFFSNGGASSLAGWLATHPPVEERIERILQQPVTRASGGDTPPPLPSPAATAGFAGGAPAPAARTLRRGAMLEHTGEVRPERIAFARQVLESLPERLHTAAHDLAGARALLYGLLLSDDAAVRERQQMRLAREEDPAVGAALEAAGPEIRALHPVQRLPLAELCIRTLRALPDGEVQRFIDHLDAAIAEDGAVDLFEFTLQHMVQRHAGAAHARRADPPIRHHRLAEVGGALTTLLSCIARWDAPDEAAARTAHAAAGRDLDGVGPLAPAGACGLPGVAQALDELALAAPAVKRQALEACVRCVGADGRVSVEEAQLLRAIADAMDCPLPPPVPGALAA